MHESDQSQNPSTDPLAEIIRAAGRRPVPPQEHYDQVYEAARTVWRRKLRAKRRTRWLAVAASIGVIALGGASLQWLLGGDVPAASVALVRGRIEQQLPGSEDWIAVPGPAAVLNAGTRVRTGDDDSAALWLADGGSLRLNTNTDLILGTESFELIAGRLYFDSAGRPTATAIDIQTAHGTVRDIGTQFEVQALPRSMRVRVRSGEIVIFGNAGSSDVNASVGEEIFFSGSAMPVRSTIAPDDPEWAWAQSLAVAPDSQSQSIYSYLTWISLETGKRLVFESETVEIRAQLARFNGDARRVTPLELLMLIAATSDFNYELTSDGTILVGRNVEP